MKIIIPNVNKLTKPNMIVSYRLLDCDYCKKMCVLLLCVCVLLYAYICVWKQEVEIKLSQ